MEYMIIYGSTNYYSEPFVFAVTNDQNMINGIKSEFPDICFDYKKYNDNRYDDFIDYHVICFNGRFMTQRMFTDFYDNYMSIHSILLDIVNLDIDVFKWNDDELDEIINGITELEEAMSYGPLELDDLLYGPDNLLKHDIVNIDKLIENFLFNFEITNTYF